MMMPRQRDGCDVHIPANRVSKSGRGGGGGELWVLLHRTNNSSSFPVITIMLSPNLFLMDDSALITVYIFSIGMTWYNINSETLHTINPPSFALHLIPWMEKKIHSPYGFLSKTKMEKKMNLVDSESTFAQPLFM